jgi:hypothetical protein
MIFSACNQGAENKQGNASVENTPAEKIENQSAMDSSLNPVIAEYLVLKDGFVEADTIVINKAAINLLSYIDSLYPDDDTLAATPVKSLFTNISAESKGLLGEADLNEKRKSFSMISENLHDLLTLVNYRGSKIYQQTCPMAFNDTEAATWLSDSREVVNPYLGKKHPKYAAGMLHCGEVTDSIINR